MASSNSNYNFLSESLTDINVSVIYTYLVKIKISTKTTRDLEKIYDFRLKQVVSFSNVSTLDYHLGTTFSNMTFLMKMFVAI